MTIAALRSLNRPSQCPLQLLSARSRRFPGAFRALQTRSPRLHQLSSRHPQVAQREQPDDLCRVLCQASVAHLSEPERPLQH